MRWGQGSFHFPTPAWLYHAKRSSKNSTSTTSMGLQGNPWGIARWFSIFCLVYFCVIPYLDSSHLRFSAWLKRIGLPVIPLWLGLCFLLAYAISRQWNMVAGSATHCEVHQRVSVRITFRVHRHIPSAESHVGKAKKRLHSYSELTSIFVMPKK